MKNVKVTVSVRLLVIHIAVKNKNISITIHFNFLPHTLCNHSTFTKIPYSSMILWYPVCYFINLFHDTNISLLNEAC